MSSDLVVTKLIEDLEAGNSEAAVARIRSIETLTGRPRLVTTSRQFVERMRGCKLVSRNGSGEPTFKIERTEWACTDGAYEVAFVGEPGTSYVTVAEFSDPTRVAERKARPAVAPPAPMIMAPPTREQQAAQESEQARILEAFGLAVGKGDLANMAAYIAPTTRFALGYRDVANSTTVIEMDGDGIEEGQRQIDWLAETFGQPTSTNCGREGVVARCLLRFAKPGSVLIFPGIWKGKVLNVQFLYVNEKVFLINAPAIQGTGNK